MLAFAVHTSYQKKLKVLSFYGLWVCVTCLKISYASHDYVEYEMYVCMCVKQQTDNLYVICIVVIDSGWNF